VNLVYTIEVERVGVFDWSRDAVPIKRDPLWPREDRNAIHAARRIRHGGRKHAGEGRPPGRDDRAILENMKPEAAYFYAEDGKRLALVFYEMDDASRIPAVAEPWFLALNARVEIKLVMVADDLAKAGPAIEDAVRRFG
jgi:hypothetical protein